MISTTNVLNAGEVIKGLSMKKKYFDQLTTISELLLDQSDANFKLLGYVEFRETSASYGPAKYFIFQNDDGLLAKVFNTNTLTRRFKGVKVPQIFLV